MTLVQFSRVPLYVKIPSSTPGTPNMKQCSMPSPSSLLRDAMSSLSFETFTFSRSSGVYGNGGKMVPDALSADDLESN